MHACCTETFLGVRNRIQSNPSNTSLEQTAKSSQGLEENFGFFPIHINLIGAERAPQTLDTVDGLKWN